VPAGLPPAVEIDALLEPHRRPEPYRTTPRAAARPRARSLPERLEQIISGQIDELRAIEHRLNGIGNRAARPSAPIRKVATDEP